MAPVVTVKVESYRGSLRSEPAGLCSLRKQGPIWVARERYQTGTRPTVGLPQTACSVWVPDFVQQRFNNMSPGDFDCMFIKAGDSETRKGLG